MVVFDSSVLLLVLDPKVEPPIDPATDRPVERAAERIEHLISTLAKAGEKIIIPTPVLSEVLIYAGPAMQRIITDLNSQACFRIADFNQKAAIEAALSMRDALDRGGLRVDAANPDDTKTKIKFDRQIVAIAKAEGAHTVYTDDNSMIGYAQKSKLHGIRTADLDLPPEEPQQSLDLNDGREDV